MNKIFTLFFTACFFFLSTVNAQPSFGIRAGINSATWSGDALQSFNQLADLTNGYVTTKGRTAFHAGAYAQLPLGSRFSIEPGIFYSQKGFTMKGELESKVLDFLGANATMQVQSHYIDVPVLLKANVIEGLHVYAGPQFSYLVENNLHMDAGALGFSLLNKNMNITDQFNPTDWSIVGGVGYTFTNGVTINAAYDHGLSRLDKNGNFKSYNKVFKIGFGFQF